MFLTRIIWISVSLGFPLVLPHGFSVCYQVEDSDLPQSFCTFRYAIWIPKKKKKHAKLYSIKLHEYGVTNVSWNKIQHSSTLLWQILVALLSFSVSWTWSVHKLREQMSYVITFRSQEPDSHIRGRTQFIIPEKKNHLKNRLNCRFYQFG